MRLRLLPVETLDRLRAELSALAVPVCPADDPTIGLDGTGYSLLINGPGFQRAHFTWWHTHPTAWRPLMA